MKDFRISSLIFFSLLFSFVHHSFGMRRAKAKRQKVQVSTESDRLRFIYQGLSKVDRVKLFFAWQEILLKKLSDSGQSDGHKKSFGLSEEEENNIFESPLSRQKDILETFSAQEQEFDLESPSSPCGFVPRKLIFLNDGVQISAPCSFLPVVSVSCAESVKVEQGGMAQAQEGKSKCIVM